MLIFPQVAATAPKKAFEEELAREEALETRALYWLLQGRDPQEEEKGPTSIAESGTSEEPKVFFFGDLCAWQWSGFVLRVEIKTR